MRSSDEPVSSIDERLHSQVSTRVRIIPSLPDDPESMEKGVKPKKAVKRTFSPSFGWLDAFLCTADRGSYEKAGLDLDLSARRVRGRVERLETWCRKMLAYEVNGLPSLEEDGEKLVFIALDILQAFDAHRAGPAHTLPKHSHVTLADFENFVSVVSAKGKYEAAASSSGVNVTTLWHSVNTLEHVLGRSLLSGRSQLKLTTDGSKFYHTAVHIRDTFNSFRSELPDIYQAMQRTAELYFKLNRRNMAALSAAILITESRKRNFMGRRDLLVYKEKLEFSRNFHEDLIREFGPFQTISGAEVDISNINQEFPHHIGSPIAHEILTDQAACHDDGNENDQN